MTRELIEQYADLQHEVRELEVKLRSPVTDVVMGSSSNYPYTEHRQTVTGVPGASGYRHRINELRQMCAEIDKFVDALPTSRQRRIARLKMSGLTWNEVAAKMGYMYSVDSVRKCYVRAIDDKIALDKELAECR